MILVGLGGNVDSIRFGSPVKTLEAAIEELSLRSVGILSEITWWKSPPDPPSDQPWFVNGVIKVKTRLEPEELLEVLFEIEQLFGRVRVNKNESRPIDLDLLDFDGQIRVNFKEKLTLPHPRMHLRSFVLQPLARIAPEWKHPILGLSAKELYAELPRESWAKQII